MDNVLSLLREIKAITNISREKERQAFLRGEQFNIFEILRLSSSEVRLHSAVLGNLLDPNSSHALGTQLLKEFINILPVKVPPLNFSKAAVTLEECHGPISEDGLRGGNIDLVIHFPNFHIIIENKIFANDQDLQIMRYHNEYENEPHLLLYLSLDGHEPSDKSSGSLQCGKDFYTISYAAHILKWLEECKKIAFDKPLVRETIKQYCDTIKTLTNQLMDKTEKEKLFEHMDMYPDAVNAIVNEQWSYRLHLVEKYIITPLKIWCEQNRLVWYEDADFRNQSKAQGFGIKRSEWTKMIAGEFDRINFCDLSYGVWDPENRGTGETLLGDKKNDSWPYGWKYMEPYGSWQLSIAQDIIEGKVAKELINTFDDLLQKIERYPEKFPMN